jgi:hypothetical protein
MPSFLTVPREVRDEIYKHAIQDSLVQVDATSRERFTLADNCLLFCPSKLVPTATSLLRVSYQVHDEFKEVLVRLGFYSKPTYSIACVVEAVPYSYGSFNFYTIDVTSTNIPVKSQRIDKFNLNIDTRRVLPPFASTANVMVLWLGSVLGFLSGHILRFLERIFKGELTRDWNSNCKLPLTINHVEIHLQTGLEVLDDELEAKKMMDCIVSSWHYSWNLAPGTIQKLEWTCSKDGKKDFFALDSSTDDD